MDNNRELVYIRWLDHSSYNADGWVREDELVQNSKPLEVETFGFVVLENKTSLTVGQSITECGAVGGNITIIKRDILERRKLSKGRKNV